MPIRERLSRGATAGVLACLGLAIASVFVLPSTPSYDPWAWIVWGRELASATFTFGAGGGPSWKPLPVMFTTVFGLFGTAAPTLWLIAARAGGLLALFGAYRLGSRLAGRVAGTIAVLALLLTQETVGGITQDWIHYMFRGVSEPMLVACVLWAIDRHLEGRRGAAFALGVATSLIRPEAWPFLGLYVLWLWRREPRLRPPIVGGLALIPVMWFGPPWISTGHPLAASTQAQQYNGHLGSDPLITTLSRGAHLTIVPVLVAAAVAVLLAIRRREQVTLWLAGGAAAWVALVVAMAVDGYPGLGRFMYPPAAIACVLAGVGVVGLAELAGPGWRRWGVIAAVLAASVPFTTGRVSLATGEKHQADLAVTATDQLNAAVRELGGRRAVLPCPTSVAAVNHTMQTALAWTLGVHLSRVKTVVHSPGVDFVGPHIATIDGAAAPVRLQPHTTREIARSGIWRVLQVTRLGDPDSCVGT